MPRRQQKEKCSNKIHIAQPDEKAISPSQQTFHSIPFAIHCDGHILISLVFPQFTSYHSVFHSFHGLMNSINWPASSIWVFIAQLGEHCSANAEATGSNPVEAPKNFFSGYFRNCLNCDSLRWSHTHFRHSIVEHLFS